MLKITRTDHGYLAEVGPPHGDAPWTTVGPVGLRALIEKLHELNCHQTDIGDALDEADPEWLFRLASEVASG